jgi:hypothetical protein
MSVFSVEALCNRTLSEQGYREVARQFFSRIAKAFFSHEEAQKAQKGILCFFVAKFL